MQPVACHRHGTRLRKPISSPTLFVAVLSAALFMHPVVALSDSANAAGTLMSGGSWHRSDTELYSPVFSPNGNEIALVAKRHMPDGEEAEAMTKGELKRREARIDRDPRYADPVIYVLHLRDRTTERVDYGWDPAFSPDATSLAYAFQFHAISRFRVLAETLADNDICVFDRTTKVSKIIAKPDSGHLSSPQHSPDGRAVVFGLGGAINGAYAGLVGVGSVNLEDHLTSDIYPRLKAFNLPRLIKSFGFVGADLFAIVETPTGSGMYLANSYRTELVKIENEPYVVYSWGDLPVGRAASTAFGVGTSGSLRVYDTTWRNLGDRADEAQLPTSRGPSDPGVLSPDGRWLARRARKRLEIVDLSTNQLKRSIQTSAEIQEVTWSPDSARLAWIAIGDPEKFRFDELHVATR
jgi:hypothetical protein